MKLLLFSDVHSSKKHLDVVKKKAKYADILCCLGDISMFEAHLKRILKELDELGKTVLMLPGNHELEEDLHNACMNLKNIIYLHKDSYKLDDTLFLAYGSGGFAQRDHVFERLAKEWEKLLQKKRRVILLTHGPPYGTSVDRIGRSHVGNISIAKFIKKHQDRKSVA